MMTESRDRLTDRIAQIDWKNVADCLNSNGFAVVPSLLSNRECQGVISGFANDLAFRKTVVMERYRFGRGVYKYWNYPLPDLVQTLREGLYPKLSMIANEWMKMLKIERSFPDDLSAFSARCLETGQAMPTPLILKYSRGGYNTLHQDLFGDTYFPIQAVCFLSARGMDYTGGELVLTQQIPRAQSKAIVLAPDVGDVVLFATNFRPIKGSRGYYRSTTKHGVSEVHEGERYTMGVIFHDGAT